MALQKYRMASLKDKFYNEPNRTNYVETTLEDGEADEEKEKVEVTSKKSKKKNGRKKS